MQIPEYENYHETKSHSTPDFPYNAYICSIPLDFEKVRFTGTMRWKSSILKRGVGASH